MFLFVPSRLPLFFFFFFFFFFSPWPFAGGICWFSLLKLTIFLFKIAKDFSLEVSEIFLLQNSYIFVLLHSNGHCAKREYQNLSSDEIRDWGGDPLWVAYLQPHFEFWSTIYIFTNTFFIYLSMNVLATFIDKLSWVGCNKYQLQMIFFFRVCMCVFIAAWIVYLHNFTQIKSNLF